LLLAFSVRVWAEDVPLATLKKHIGEVRAIAFHPNGKWLASGDVVLEKYKMGGSLYLWDVEGGEVIRSLPVQQPVTALTISPDGRMLAAGLSNFDEKTKRLHKGHVLVWDLEGNRQVSILSGPDMPITALAFDPDGALLVAGSLDQEKAVRLWEPKSRKLVREWKGKDLGANIEVRSVAFSTDGGLLAVGMVKEAPKIGGAPNISSLLAGVQGSGARTVRLWAVGTGQEVYLLPESYRERSEVGRRRERESPKGLGFPPAPLLVFGEEGKSLVAGSTVWEAPDGFKGGTEEIFVKPRSFAGVVGGGETAVCLSGKLMVGMENVQETVEEARERLEGGGRVRGEMDRSRAIEKKGAMRVCDMGTGKLIQEIRTPGPIADIALSPDGRYLASAEGTVIRLWDPAGGAAQARLIRTFSKHDGPVRAVVIRPDGRLLVSGGEDRRIKTWEVESGERGNTLLVSHPVLSAAFSPDGKRVVASDEGGNWTVFDASQGFQELSKFSAHRGRVSSVAFDPNGGRFASAGVDGVIGLWDADDFKELRRLKFDGGQSNVAITFWPDGKFLVSADEKGKVLWWDLEDGSSKELFSEEGGVSALSADPKGKAISVASGRKIVVWDVEKAEKRWTSRELALPVTALAFGPDGRCLASGGMDKRVRVWDAASGREQLVGIGHEGGVSCVAYGPKGDVLVSGSFDQTCKLWDVAMQALHTFEGAGAVAEVAFSPDGKMLASGRAAGPFEIRDVQSWGSLSSPKVSAVSCVFFSSDSRTLAVGPAICAFSHTDLGWKEERRAGLLQAGQVVFASAFSPDGKWMALAGEDKVQVKERVKENQKYVTKVRMETKYVVRIYKVEQGKVEHTLDSPEAVADLVFPSGEYVACAGVEKIRIWRWDRDRWKMRELLDGPEKRITIVASSPDGLLLAAAGEDGAIWLGRKGVEGWSRRAVIERHEGGIASIAFSPDGKRMATGGVSDRKVRFWDVDSGKETGVLSGHVGTIKALAFHPDGKLLASGSDDKTVKIWEVPQ
jgi:WD40 repeat protein